VLTIVWDVDDVLNDLTRLWLAQMWRPVHPDAPAFAELTENPPHALLGTSLAAYLASLDDFRHSGVCVEQPPLCEVREWFGEHGAQFRHVALTAVPLHAAGLSAAWVLRHYGSWIRSFNVVPSPRQGDVPAPMEHDKAAWIAWAGVADVFVDDSQENVDTVRRAGVPALLFPRPWNADSGRPVADLLSELAALARAAARPSEESLPWRSV